MIDAHCHLNFHAFDNDVDDVIKRAHEKGIEIIINVGTSIPSSRKAIELAEKYEHLYAIVGIHPHHADKTDKEFEGELQIDWQEKLEKMIQHPKVVGIGEIGMDYFYYQSNGIVEKKLQEEVFIAQIELAHKYNKPLQIHNRLAGHDVVAILRRNKHLLKQNNPGMFHCFAGDLEVHKGALDLGFCIGFDGNSTYPGLAPKETVLLSDIAKATPLDRMITETDSPYLSPVPLRGTRNQPKNVIIVGEFLANLKGVSFEEFSEITTKNTKTLFGLQSAL
jgi:TatD DNase family protein